MDASSLFNKKKGECIDTPLFTILITLYTIAESKAVGCSFLLLYAA